MSFHTLLSRIVRACLQRAEIVHAGHIANDGIKLPS